MLEKSFLGRERLPWKENLTVRGLRFLIRQPHYSGMGWGLEIVNRVWRHDLMMNYAAQTEAKLIFG